MPPGWLDLFHVNSRGLCRGDSRLVAFYRHEVNADIFLDSLRHRKTLPAGGQVNILLLPSALICAENAQRGAGQQILEQVHHVVEVGIGLIKLNGRELWVVLCVHALVAEDAADLIHTLDTAHDEALEVELGGDAQIHIDIQRIVVGYKRSGRRAAGNGVENGRLDLHIAASVKEGAHIAYEL